MNNNNIYLALPVPLQIIITMKSAQIARQKIWGGFFVSLWYAFKSMLMYGTIVLCLGRKGGIILGLYSWFRNADDILDDEREITSGETKKGFLEMADHYLDLLFSDQAQNISHFADLRYAYLESKKLGLDIEPNIREVWELMKEDFASRHTIRTRETLHAFARQQDVAIMSGATKIFGGKVSGCKYVLSSYAGIFTRIDWLNDFGNDMRLGVFTLPQEDLEKYDISIHQLDEMRMTKEMRHGLKEWYETTRKDTAYEAKRIMNQFRKDLTIIFPKNTFLQSFMFKLTNMYFGKTITKLSR